MKSWQRRFPPYDGTEPYLYFAFTESDSGRVWRIMRILLERGCRIWYSTGHSGSSQELLRRQERAGNAALTVLYLSNAACSDSYLKNSVLVNQEAGRKISCLDPDGDDRRLRMGLHESVQHIPVFEFKSGSDIESVIIHADGFLQDILGEPVKTRGGLAERLSVVLSLLALILTVTAVIGYFFFYHSEPELADEVHFADPIIAASVRTAAAGGIITEDLVSQVSFLYLDGIPESWDDLHLLPSLERIRIPQQALLEGGSLPEGDYIIELGGGTP